MAPPLPAAGLYLKVTTTVEDNRAAQLGSHMYFSYSGGPMTAAIALALATAIYGEAHTNILPLIDSTKSLYGIVVTDLNVVGGVSQEYAPGLVNGTRAGGIVPIQIAAIANYSIARRYRGGKPRGFWFFGSESDIATENEWQGTAVTAFEAGLNSYIAGISGLSSGGVTILGHVSLSYYSGFTNETYGTPTKYRRVPTPRAAPVADPIISVRVNPLLGSQRRRRGRV